MLSIPGLATAPMTTDLTEVLKTIYLFQSLSDQQLNLVAKTTRCYALGAGERLFSQGDPIERFFFLQSGQVKLYRLSPDGDEKIIELVCAGQAFAEAVVFMGKHGYPVNADVLVASELLGFDAHVFMDLLKQSNETCLRLMADMSVRLRSQVNEIDRLTLHSATFRFINYLLDPPPNCMVSAEEIRLNVPKSVLASRLSIQPETFSRILSRLANAGLIEVRRESIRLLDTASLQARLQDLN